jgi:hypothetical protein
LYAHKNKLKEKKLLSEAKKKKTLHKNRAGGVAQGECHEFKPQYRKKERN